MDTTRIVRLIAFLGAYGLVRIIFLIRGIRSAPKKTIERQYYIVWIGETILGFLILLWILFYILPIIDAAGS